MNDSHGPDDSPRTFAELCCELEGTWAAPLRAAVGELLWRRQLHDDVRELLVSDGRKVVYFWPTFHRMYLDSQLVAIRRLVDDDPRTRSLRRFLGQISKHRRQLTRSAFVARHVDELMADHKPRSADWDVWYEIHTVNGHSTFDQYSSSKKPGFVSDVDDDKDRLISATQQIGEHVNWFVAHDEMYSPEPSVTYDELDQAITTMDEIVCKYSLLVCGSAPETTLPTAQGDPLGFLRGLIDG